jgi:tripartite ATP-independent transporter DctP family solute receptor
MLFFSRSTALVSSLALAASLVFTVGDARAQEKREIKLSHSHQPSTDSEIHTSAQIFESFVEAASETLDVQIYPNNALGDERTVYEAMQLGSGATCAMTGTAILNNFSPRIGVIDLPFLWRDYDHIHKVLDGPVGDALAADLRQVGFEVVAWMDSWGYRNVVTANKIVEVPEDLQGLKIRTIQTPVYVEALNAMGANATPMAFGEVYTAMQTGVIDGFEHGSAVIRAQKFYEVSKNIALTRHLITPIIFVCSASEWAKFDEAQKNAILGAAKFAQDVNRALAPIREREAFAFLEGQGMQITTVDTSQFAENAIAIQDGFAENQGAADLLEMIRGSE